MKRPLPGYSKPPKMQAKSLPSSVSEPRLDEPLHMACRADTQLAGTSGAQSKKRLEQGFDMVSICTDVGAIAAEFDRQLAATHGVEIGKGRSVY